LLRPRSELVERDLGIKRIDDGWMLGSQSAPGSAPCRLTQSTSVI
jgi:hypothetical protein